MNQLNAKKTHWGKIGIGLGISAVCLWLAFRNVPLSELSSRITSIDPQWVAYALFWFSISIAVRAKRWCVLLENKPGVVDAFWAQNIGFFVNNILPLRLGEPARIMVLSRQSQLPFFQVAAAAVVERIQDIFMILCLLLIVLPWINAPVLVAQSGMALGGIALAALMSLFVAVWFDQQFAHLLTRLLRKIQIKSPSRWLGFWSEFVQGIKPSMRVDIAAATLFWSIMAWFFCVLIYWCALRAFVPDATLLEAGFALVVLALAISVPSSPGFIGVFQYAGQQALVIPFGDKYDPSTALAITLTAHASNYFVTSLFGVAGLWQCSQSFSSILKFTKSPTSPIDDAK